MIAVNTNIIAHFWLPSDHTQLCDQLFQWYPEWVAPILWRMNSGMLWLIIKKTIILLEALQITKKAENQMHGREFHVNSVQVYSLTEISDSSSYNCEFVGLTEGLNIKD